MTPPLSGVTVVEIAGIGPLPFTGMLLADLGAKIIRVERIPPADPAAADRLQGIDFVDRGRESLSINLKAAEGLGALLRLVDKADVLIEGYRPGVAERLGFGPEVCHRRNPALVFGRMTGWGQSGPLAAFAGHDINYISLSGALHAMGEAANPPSPPLNLVGDYGGGGMLLALGVTAALLQAKSTGIGQVVDAAMLDGSALLMSGIFGFASRGLWQAERGANFLDGSAPFYRCYACSDGRYVAVGAVETHFYNTLLAGCGMATVTAREQWDQALWPEMRERLARTFLERTRDEWCALLERTDSCLTPVLSMEEAARHEHCAARATFVPGAAAPQPAPAPRFSGSDNRAPAVRHSVGSDSARLLAEAGLSGREIDGLLASGIVHQAEA